MSDKPEESEYDPDEIEALSASEAGSVVDALDRNRNQILFLIAGSAVIICAVLVLGQMRKQKHVEAAQAYATALSKGEIAGLDGVVVDFGGSVAAGNALLSKAELQINQGKPQDAQETLETFVANYEDHPRHVQGIFALGNLFHIAGDTERARSQYQKAIDEQPDGEITPLARIRLGDLALESGEIKVADQQYQEAYTLHPGTPFFDYAEEKIALLAVGDPPVVERPEPPKPEPKPEPEAAPKAEAEATPQPDAVAVPKPVEPAPAAGTPAAGTPAAGTPAAGTPAAGTPAAGKGKGKAQPKTEVPPTGDGKAKAPNPKAKAKAPEAGNGKGAAPKGKAKAPGNTPQSQGPAPKAKADPPRAEAPAPVPAPAPDATEN